MKRAALAVVVLSGCAAAGGENLVRNGGFEELSADGGALAAWGRPKRAGVRFAWDEEVRHSGKRSARVEGVDAARQSRFVQAWRQDVGPLPKGELRLSVWVKGKDITQGRINVLHKDANGQVLRNQGIAGFEGTFDWKEIAGPLKSVPGTKSLQLVMGLVKSTGTAWFDDVCVSSFAVATRDAGRVAITPAEPQQAGSTVPIRVAVVVGKRGLGEGGSIRLRWENWRPAREFRLRKFRVECEGTSAAFEVSVPPRKKTWPPTRRPIACIATLKQGGPLKEGDKVVVSAALTYTRYTNVACGMQVLVCPKAGAAAHPLGGRFVARAKGGPARRLLCLAEARPLAGKPGRLTVAATDAYGNPAADFRGTVRLRCNTDAGLPAEHAFTEADAGSRDFVGTFPGGLVSRVQVTERKMTAVSNPILPRKPDEPGVYFGDIHSHCELSADAVGGPDQAYDYARRFWGLDFAALTDHSPRGAKWPTAVAAANRHNKAGRFVTFVGFEWSHPVHGHRNAYYRDGGPEQPRRVRDNMRSWWKLLDAKKLRVLTVPHHPNTQSRAKRPDGKSVWGPVDWSVVNHTYQRIVEICQIRGSFEVPGGPKPNLRVVRADCGASVQTALAKGHRLGFIGSTDTHSGRPGTGPARCAILSTDFSRSGLWDALHSRTCYATSGKHILVLFTLNGRPMGSAITLSDPRATREVKWRVIGTGPLKRVDLLRSNTVVRSWQAGGRDDLSDTFRVEGPISRAEWWYLRAVQEDKEMAWSSPIWIDRGKGDRLLFQLRLAPVRLVGGLPRRKK